MWKRGWSASVLEIERGQQRFLVGGYRLVVFAEARDVARDRVFRHLSGFFQRAPIGDASGQRRDQRGVAALGFWTQHDVVTVPGLRHPSIIVPANRIFSMSSWSSSKISNSPLNRACA